MMVGGRIHAGRVYRTGRMGAALRLDGGVLRTLPANYIFVFDVPGEVVIGSVHETAIVPKQRHDYDDKQRRGYEDKSA